MVQQGTGEVRMGTQTRAVPAGLEQHQVSHERVGYLNHSLLTTSLTPNYHVTPLQIMVVTRKHL